MTQMSDFINLTIEQRMQCTFIPFGERVYNGLGYSLGPKAGWNDNKKEEFEQWRRRHNVKFDSVVYEFPNEETFLMARLIFE